MLLHPKAFQSFPKFISNQRSTNSISHAVMSSIPTMAAIIAKLGSTLACHMGTALISFHDHFAFVAAFVVIPIFEKRNFDPFAFSQMFFEHAFHAEYNSTDLAFSFFFIFLHLYKTSCAFFIWTELIITSFGL